MNNEKFNLRYKLEIEGLDDLITYPITCQFTVRNTIGSAEPVADFTLYGLQEKKRQYLYRDWSSGNLKTALSVVFYVGYEDNLSIVYKGKMWYAYSSYNKVNWITKLTCRISTTGIGNMTSFSLSKNSKVKDLFASLQSTLKKQNINLTKISASIANIPLKTGYSHIGNVWDVIKSYAPNYHFDRFGDLYLLENNETVDEIVINSNTGMLSTPRREQGKLLISTLLEPKIDVNNLVQLESIDPIYNGDYQVISLQHTGVISGSMQSTGTTNLELFVGVEELRHAK